MGNFEDQGGPSTARDQPTAIHTPPPRASYGSPKPTTWSPSLGSRAPGTLAAAITLQSQAQPKAATPRPEGRLIPSDQPFFRGDTECLRRSPSAPALALCTRQVRRSPLGYTHEGAALIHLGRRSVCAPEKGGKGPDSLRAVSPHVNPTPVLPPLAGIPGYPQEPFALRDGNPSTVVGVALVHRHLATGPLPPPLRWGRDGTCAKPWGVALRWGAEIMAQKPEWARQLSRDGAEVRETGGVKIETRPDSKRGGYQELVPPPGTKMHRHRAVVCQSSPEPLQGLSHTLLDWDQDLLLFRERPRFLLSPNTSRTFFQRRPGTRADCLVR